MKKTDNVSIVRIRRDAFFWGSIVLAMWIFFAFNIYARDYENYRNLYNTCIAGYKINGIEFGYVILMKIAGIFRLDFRKFHVLIATIYIFCIARFVNNHAEKRSIIMLLIVLYPYILDTIQLRNALAECVLLLGYDELLYITKEGVDAKKIFKFLLIVTCAAQFHTSAYMYVLLLLIVLKERMLNIVVFWGLGIELILICFSNKILLRLSFLIPKAQLYVQNGAWSTKLLTKIVFLILVVGIPAFLKILQGIENSDEYKLTYKISIICILYYLFFTIDVDFFRIYRNCIIYIYISLINNIGRLSLEKKKVLFYAGVFIFAIMMNYAFIAYQSDNINNIITYNSLWKR